MKAAVIFVRRVAASRLGQFLVVAHLLFIVYDFAQKPAATYSDTPCVVEPSSAAFIAGRNYHWHYESNLLKIVSLLDFPALVLVGLASTVLFPLKLCAFTTSWVEAILALTFASIQWLLVGFIVEAVFQTLKKWKAGAFNQRTTSALATDSRVTATSPCSASRFITTLVLRLLQRYPLRRQQPCTPSLRISDCQR